MACIHCPVPAELLKQHLNNGKHSEDFHAISLLVGQIKGEMEGGEQHRMMVLAREQRSEMQAGIWKIDWQL
jgi:hypothetical protein